MGSAGGHATEVREKCERSARRRRLRKAIRSHFCTLLRPEGAEGDLASGSLEVGAVNSPRLRSRRPKSCELRTAANMCHSLARASRTRDDGSAGYFLVELGKLCGFHTWPSHRRRTDHHVPGGGRVLESPDMTKRQRRTLQGAIGARGARCAARCELFWRTFPAGEASPSIPSHARSLAPRASLLY